MKNWFKTRTKTRSRQVKISIILLLILSAGLFGNTLYIQAKAVFAQHLIAKAWVSTQQHNHSAHISNPKKPWTWADTYPVAKLTVPKTQEYYYVLAGATGSPLAFGPGLYAGTALPGITDTTIPDTIIAGHHNTHFAFLKDLNVGEEITLENHLGKTIRYRIKHIENVDIRHHQLATSYTGNHLTLVTCTPRFSGEINPTQRLLVTAEILNI